MLITYKHKSIAAYREWYSLLSEKINRLGKLFPVTCHEAFNFRIFKYGHRTECAHDGAIEVLKFGSEEISRYITVYFTKNNVLAIFFTL